MNKKEKNMDNCSKIIGKNPIFSIITPLFNSEKFFGETINSVFSQTFKNFEWIIVDDMSADSSYDIAQNASKKYSQIKLFRLDKNSGSAKARNYGLDHASGRYITFLDSDDLWDETFLEKTYELLTKNNWKILTLSYKRLCDGKITKFIVPEITSNKSILKGNPISCLSTTFEFEPYKEIRFDESLQKHEDYLFWINILKKGEVCHGVNDALATYRLISTSKNRKKTKLVLPMVFLYHKKLKYNIIISWYFTIRYCWYSFRKYRNA